MLTTFNTSHGHYRWLRMPFGLNSAAEEFQRRQNQTVQRLRGVLCVHDDILTFGKGSTGRKRIGTMIVTSELSWVAVVTGIWSWKGISWIFVVRKFDFWGHLLISDGVYADPDKVINVKDMLTPIEVLSIRRLVGFIIYVSKFLPRLSDNLGNWLIDVRWCWLDNHTKAMQDTKNLVCTRLVLKYYDPNEE